VGFFPFYYMKEVLPSKIPSHLTVLPEDFEFSTFVPADVIAMSKHPERKGYPDEQQLINNLENGDTCLGIKYKNQIAGFTWFSTRDNPSRSYHPSMRNDEAYLYDMFIFNAFRGHNLAPILRYKNYEVLRELGRNTFYSVTWCYNTAALRFKQKLNSKIVLLGVEMSLFKKWRKAIVVKKY
jgi:hypothetical protein